MPFNPGSKLSSEVVNASFSKGWTVHLASQNQFSATHTIYNRRNWRENGWAAAPTAAVDTLLIFHALLVNKVFFKKYAIVFKQAMADISAGSKVRDTDEKLTIGILSTVPLIHELCLVEFRSLVSG